MSTTYETTIDEIGSWDRRREVRDEAKVVSLIEGMRLDGWDGPPLVVNSVTCEIYTGVHRLAALEALAWAGADPIQIPVYDVEADFRADDGRGFARDRP